MFPQTLNCFFALDSCLVFENYDTYTESQVLVTKIIQINTCVFHITPFLIFIIVLKNSLD